MALSPPQIFRYPAVYGINTALDPFDDVLVLIESLTSSEYLIDTIKTAHGLSTTDARARSRKIIPHIRTALGFIQQSLSGPDRLAFLPIYYGLLNFAKVYVLLSSHHAQLEKNRLHGAHYPGHKKDSQTLLTEEIILRPTGTIPLFYSVLTGHRISRDIRIRMSDVFRFVVDIGAEYRLATSQSLSVAHVQFQFVPVGSIYSPLVSVRAFSGVMNISLRDLKLLRNFTSEPGRVDSFRSASFVASPSGLEQFRERLRPFLLYSVPQGHVTPICSKHLLLPEELPLLLMFYHLSNVVRYKPEFLARVSDSRYWPMLLAAKRHSLFKFLVLTWSFVHQQSLVIGRA